QRRPATHLHRQLAGDAHHRQPRQADPDCARRHLPPPHQSPHQYQPSVALSHPAEKGEGHHHPEGTRRDRIRAIRRQGCRTPHHAVGILLLRRRRHRRSPGRRPHLRRRRERRQRDGVDVLRIAHGKVGGAVLSSQFSVKTWREVRRGGCPILAAFFAARVGTSTFCSLGINDAGCPFLFFCEKWARRGRSLELRSQRQEKSCCPQTSSWNSLDLDSQSCNPISLRISSFT